MVKRKLHIFGVHGPILTILVSIVGFSGCLSWLNLFSKWLYVKVIVKRSFSRSNLQKMSVWKACRCLIQDLNGLIANYIPIMQTTSFSLSIFCLITNSPVLWFWPFTWNCMCAVTDGGWHVTEMGLARFESQNPVRVDISIGKNCDKIMGFKFCNTLKPYG